MATKPDPESGHRPRDSRPRPPRGGSRDDLSLPVIQPRLRIVEINIGALQGWLTDLRSNDPAARAAARDAFRHLTNGDAMPILLKALYHPLADVRRDAAAALELIGTPEALAALNAWAADFAEDRGEEEIVQ